MRIEYCMRGKKISCGQKKIKGRSSGRTRREIVGNKSISEVAWCDNYLIAAVKVRGK